MTAVRRCFTLLDVRDTTIGFRVEPDLLARLDAAAAVETRTRSNLITRALVEYLDKHHPETT